MPPVPIAAGDLRVFVMGSSWASAISKQSSQVSSVEMRYIAEQLSGAGCGITIIGDTPLQSCPTAQLLTVPACWEALQLGADLSAFMCPLLVQGMQSARQRGPSTTELMFQAITARWPGPVVVICTDELFLLQRELPGLEHAALQQAGLTQEEVR